MDRNRIFAALVLTVTALFLFSGAPGFRYRRIARSAAIIGYAAVFLAVAIYVVLWLCGIVG
jgi:hypothetical protein